VTGPNPSRQPDPGMRPGAPGALDAVPDPWGVRRAENLLTQLEGVLSARVVTTPLGEVAEVHVLAQAGLSPKQLVRNIESALLAHLGLKVDHRKISIAQTAEVRPIETLDKAAVRERALQRSILYEDLVVQSASRPQRLTVAVTLSCAGQQETGAEEVPDSPRSRLEGAARATLKAVERFVEKGGLALESVQLIGAVDRDVVFVAVQGLGGRDSVLLTGTAEVRQHPERAAVFAVLDATNRWAEARRPA
jgi:hypothetical protein